jgi:hypothetical protein
METVEIISRFKSTKKENKSFVMKQVLISS